MTPEQFKKSAIEWHKLVYGDDSRLFEGFKRFELHYIDAQKYYYSFMDGGFFKSEDVENVLFAACDLLWCGAFFIDIKRFEAKEQFDSWHDQLLTTAEFNNLNFAHYLQATADSNWSKIVVDKGMAPAVDHLDPKRFKKVRFSGNHSDGKTYCWIIGNDHQDPQNIQRDKVLKPTGFVSKEEALKSILNS